MRIVAALVLLVTSTASAATNWVEDLRYLGRELPRRHANAFHRITNEDFAKSIAELEAKAATANDSEMFVGLSRITAAVGDAHTYAKIGPAAHRFPLGLVRYGDDYRVVQTIERYRSALGARVIRIGSTPVEEAAKQLAPLIPQAETEAFIRSNTTAWLTLGDALHGLGIIASPSRATYTLLGDDGSVVTLDVESVPAGSKSDSIFASEKTPLARQRPGETFWFEWIEASKCVYVAWRGYDDLRAKSKALWDLVDARQPGKLIIDLRGNSGGDFNKGRSFIVAQVKKRPKLRVFVLVGARTFSAAMTNAVDLRNAGATLVGGTIGERPNSYQENDEMTLPSSKIVVSYSTRLYKFVPEDAPNVVEPDQKIENNWEEFKAGRDPVLEWALAE